MAQGMHLNPNEKIDESHLKRMKGADYMKSEIPTVETLPDQARPSDINLVQDHINNQKPLYLKYTDNDGQQFLQTLFINQDTKKTADLETSSKKEDSKPSILKENSAKINASAPQSENKSGLDNQNNQNFSDNFSHLQTKVDHSSNLNQTPNDQRFFLNEFSIKLQETINQIKNNQKNQSAKFEIEVNELGTVKTQVEKNGETLTIRFESENSQKSELLKDNLQNLESQLKEKGYSQVDIEYNFNDSSNENNSQYTNPKKRHSLKNTNNTSANLVESDNQTSTKNYGYNSMEYVI
jgi:hypothetical protein